MRASFVAPCALLFVGFSVSLPAPCRQRQHDCRRDEQQYDEQQPSFGDFRRHDDHGTIPPIYLIAWYNLCRPI